MAANISLPSVVLFVEGTSRLEVFQKIVSGLQRAGRRVHVFVGSANAPSVSALARGFTLDVGEESRARAR